MKLLDLVVARDGCTSFADVGLLADGDDILTTREAAEYLKVTEKTVYARAAINEWIEARTHSADQNPATDGRREAAPGSRRPRKGK